jgi:outer membrane protein OmpA-like peptidoglycan-associated protein
MIEDTDCCAFLEPILFAANDASLSQEAKGVLDGLAGHLERCKSALILEAVGRRGAEEPAPRLAEERAEEVRAYVVSRGIEARRMRARGVSTPVGS